MALAIVGEHRWGGERDEQGYRTYTITFKLRSDTGRDGPANVLQTPGLPLPGAMWLFYDDVDVWVWCRPNARIKAASKEGHKVIVWEIEFTFSNKPLENNKCEDQQVDDPLLEPQRISGDFERFTEEAVKDRFGKPVKTSSHEQIRGPQNEWDASRAVIHVEQNVPVLQLGLLILFNDCVNDAPLWGFPARWIKLTVDPWEEVYYGQCYKYYKRAFSFQVKHGGWDRDIRDSGSKVLHGHWGADTGSGCTISITTTVGTGCTIDIVTAGDGSIINALVNSGGSGYPQDALITLDVDAGSGVGGVVEAVTDSSGVVTRILHPIVNAGSDYQDGNAATVFGGDEGSITSATVAAGGTGYPASGKFNLAIISGIGVGGVVSVEANGSGVVTMINKIANRGLNYATATATTNPISGWLLDDINDEPPNPNIPAHFDRFKDRQGENTTVILDGGGCPALKPEDAGKVHVEKYASANFLLLGIPVFIGP